MRTRRGSTLPGADMLDVRSLIERFEELAEIYQPESDTYNPEDPNHPTDDEVEEYKQLKEVLDEVGNCDKGVTLICETHFQEYAEQFADDIGAIQGNRFSWPLTCLDWEKAAEELKQDYSSCEYGNFTYYYQDN